MKSTKRDEGLFLAAVILILFALAVIAGLSWLASVLCG